MEITLSWWMKGSIERIYVTADGEEAGYIEKREVGRRQRRGGSYYDRHRLVKGDNVVIEGYAVSTTLPETVETALRSAADANTEDAVSNFQRIRNKMGGKKRRGYFELNRFATLKLV